VVHQEALLQLSHVQEEYAKGTEMLQLSDHHWVDEPLDHLVKQPVAYLVSWLTITQAI